MRVLGVLVMLNNFFHDLSVAMFTCGVLGRGALWGSSLGARPELRPQLEALDRLAARVALWSLVAIVGFGAVRLAAFQQYEWLPSLGREQIPALAAKHVLLVGLLLFAVWRALAVRARVRAALGGERAP